MIQLPNLSSTRVVLAFLFAPVVGVLAMNCAFLLYVSLMLHGDRFLDWDVQLPVLFSILIYFGYPATVLIGVPAFFILRQRVRFTALNCGLTGAGVCAIYLVGRQLGSFYSIKSLAFTMTIFCLPGFISGLAFWLISGPSERSDES